MHVVAFVFVCGRCLSPLVATCFIGKPAIILCLYMFNIPVQYGVVVSY